MNSSPLVSVITPFYNTRAYLAECIESVLHQSYQNYEYVLVDNCSNDGSSEIARDYAARFPTKIRLIGTGSFLSQVSNYNFAISCVSPESKYCKLVQADDWIYPECVQKLVAVAESDDGIGIVSSYRLKGNRVLGEGLPYTKVVMTGREACSLQLTTPIFVFGTPTTVLYRADVVRKHSPFYDEHNFFDDADAVYRTLKSWKFGFVHQILSFSRVDDDSIRGKVIDFQPDELDRFLQLSKFGAIYLSKAEFDCALANAKSTYYRMLARRVLSGGSEAFWGFHRMGMSSAGLKMDKKLLARHVCGQLVRGVANPGSTCIRLSRRLGAAKRATAARAGGA